MHKSDELDAVHLYIFVTLLYREEMHRVLHEEHLVVTASQMRAAEGRAMLEGISGWEMMQRAGQLAAREIGKRFRPRRVLVLCGSGNNGGDGFVIAEVLRKVGWPVEVACMVAPAALKGDAKMAAEQYRGEIVPFSSELIRPDLLLVDALFGTGLERPLEGEARHMISTADALECPLVAVDIPSGIHSDSGRVLGGAAHAALTVTFAARKPGHLLYPGREYAGEVAVVDIGLSPQMREALKDTALIHENAPDQWRYSLRFPQAHTHKYARGSAVVAGGPIACTGAARLAALSALRAGAGVVTVACDGESLPVYAAHLTAIMTRVTEDKHAFASFIGEERQRALLIGPGHGVGEKTREYTLAALATRKPCVLDADALTSFEGRAETLLAATHALTVMTPHEGEFAKLFGVVDGDKITRAMDAAKRSKAVVLLKGADTVIASPDGRAAINAIASADLATAGSGDALAGMIAGLLATGMPPFEAACAGAWMHGVAGERLGVGLIAEDLPGALPEILKYLKGL